LPAKAKSTGTAAVRDAARQFLNRFEKPGLILVAVSGGSDSKGLLIALHEAMAGMQGFSLAACTVDHALRPESAAEANAVAQFCARLGIVHLIRRWDGEKPVTGLQAAARGARYSLLSAVSLETGALCVVTGHSRNDQIETIVMRNARSSRDRTGLSGMADAVLFNRTTWILRPFLGLDRGAIRDYLLERREGWLEDPSNDSLHFERVRVRQALAEAGHAAVRDDEAGQAERQSLASQAAAFLAAHAQVYDKLVARIDPVGADACSSGAALKAILSLAACLGGRVYLPGRETTDRMRSFIGSGLDGRQTAGRVVFDRRRSGLYLYREARDLPDLRLKPGEDCIWDGRFHMRNGSKRVMSASAGTIDTQTVAGLIAAGVPQGVARRAARASPSLSMADTDIDTATPVNIGVCLAPWDTFLPRFDMILANQCAALFGRGPYKPLPVHHVFAETAGF
jgi:tRNA(Ile)-lysidine synthase